MSRCPGIARLGGVPIPALDGWTPSSPSPTLAAAATLLVPLDGLRLGRLGTLGAQQRLAVWPQLLLAFAVENELDQSAAAATAPTMAARGSLALVGNRAIALDLLALN